MSAGRSDNPPWKCSRWQMCAWLSRITATIRENELYPLVPTMQWWSTALLLYGKHPGHDVPAVIPRPCASNTLFAAEVDTFCSCRGVITLIRSEANHPLSQVHLLISLWWWWLFFQNWQMVSAGLSSWISSGLSFFFFFCSNGQLFTVLYCAPFLKMRFTRNKKKNQIINRNNNMNTI